MSDEPAEAQVAESDAGGGGSTEQVRRRRRRATPRPQRAERSGRDGSSRGTAENGDPAAGDAAPTDGASEDEPAGRTRTRRPRPERAAPADEAPERAVPVDEAPERAVPADQAPDSEGALAPPPPALPPRPPARPRIGDSRPAPASEQPSEPAGDGEDTKQGGRRRRRRGRGRGGARGGQADDARQGDDGGARAPDGRSRSDRSRGGRRRDPEPVGALSVGEPLEIDEDSLQRRRGRQRKGRPVGRYLMAVHVEHDVTHIAIVEGRNLIEYYVSRPSDDVSEIHGNIYKGKVQNVLPGMEAAFVDIGTPKNAVLYRGDVSFDKDDLDDDVRNAPTPSTKGRRGGRRRRLAGDAPRIEELLRARQQIVCQVTKNPIAHKGARLTTEVSLPGRFVVFVPDSDTTGISKRLPDAERKRLRGILDRVRPEGHGVILRTAAEDVTEAEIARDVRRLVEQWNQIQELARTSNRPTLLFREPDMAVRVIREEFNKDYRGIVIDDPTLYEQVKGYMEAVTPALADRIELYEPAAEGGLSLFERHHVSEQVRKAVDRKVWLPSGGSLIIEHTEALTVIDVNTGKNVGRSSLEETVYRNNLEAATEIARQLRLRDIGGIIVIDFIDMEIASNRQDVIGTFRDALALDKTRTQISDISELGLVQMTRKRIGEGLIESVSRRCDVCEGRGVVLDDAALGG